MTIAEMLEQSGVLTLLGMGIVFSFLFILIVCVIGSGKIIHALGLDKDVQKVAQAASVPVAVPVSASVDNSAVTAAISAAVTEYRKSHN